ncbi:methyltransferase [Halovenus sp. WSH3]|uniref:Methyltransferase n=1 Tax=Halovenus carboxidivorans TaxID=2692199 RepID=A0A6B0T2C4_9EURY|nr:METTL5 family protein [Halovenus carboxidivorans]MXR52115.1 methyltransferase [Halovenus carboxidivorans]
MSTRSQLTQQLGVVAGFDDPRVDLEQYRTPPELASYLVHVADLQGDIEDRTVVDLGCGTGMLGLAATLRGPRRVIGVDIDAAALHTAQENRGRIAAKSSVSWVQADATQVPLAPDEETTVVMNPPFGAQDGNEHADRAFLETTAEIASVSYSIHNAGSSEFVESFAADHGGEMTHAYSAEFDLPKTFEHHSAESKTIDVELFRIEW